MSRSVDNENDKLIEVNDACESRMLEGWTKDEKFRLLQAIKSYGSTDIEYITKHVESKTTEEVSYAIEVYRKKAVAACPTTSATTKLSKRKLSQKTTLAKLQAPLANWVHLLTENISFNDLNNEIATALRLIAEYEDLPKPHSQDCINFQNLYLLLANAIEGKSLPCNDEVSKCAIQKCLIETALSSKSFIRPAKLNTIHNDMTFANKDFNYYVQSTAGYELSTLRYLISQRAYNPLNVSEENLKPQK